MENYKPYNTFAHVFLNKAQQVGRPSGGLSIPKGGLQEI